MDSPLPEPSPGATPPNPSTAPAPRAPSRRRIWLGRFIALLVVLALAGAAWYLLNRKADAPPGRGFAGATVTVGHAVARQTDLPVMIDALGTVTPLATITLRPQVGGVLTEVLFTEGQTVKKGQLLARIDPRPYEQALAQARGNRQRDEAQLEAARVTLARFRTLLGQDSIARQEVDTQAALVKQLEGTGTSNRANEATAQLDLDNTRITAPVSGRIGLRAVDPGNIVAANATTGIAVVTQMTPIDVQFAVPQDRVPDIQRQLAKGEPLAVSALTRTRSATLDSGTFSTLDNIVDTSTGTMKAKARFANAEATLFPNQFVNVQLLLRKVSAVVVPVTAVRTGPNGDYVFVINEDRTVSMRTVKRGEATVEVVAIISGLQEGEKVVTEGGDRIKDGATVQLQGDQPVAGRRPGASGPRGARGQGGPRGEGGQRRPPPGP